MYGPNGGEEAHEGPEFGSKLPRFGVAPEMTVAPEAESSLGGLALDDEVHGGDERIDELGRLFDTFEMSKTMQNKTKMAQHQ